ncbi:hypothetical protein DPEC_G00141720 [Dallia pectoralis]|uniref:Uncharacterized protein n=1 Tax=Dallia pectoralis TaxID=75939 RepID=A0ACC2GN27_DALPE|nr:hypothetical protein DPEC_G00141720 [Dallia pectoralis]
MTNHLIALCQTRGVAACQIPRLSESVAGLLGLKCVLALGFRRGNEDTVFFDTVEAIVPRVPALQVAWMPRPADVTVKTDEGKLGEDTGEKGQVGEDTSEKGQVGEENVPCDRWQGEERADGQMEAETEEPRGKKRKIEDIPNVTESPSWIFQPLKVKKITPKPNKTQKPKTKKK